MSEPIVRTLWAAEEQREEALDYRLVHVAGTGQSGMDTLCGHVDRTSFRWQPGGKAKVNCKSCLRIWAYVKDHRLP